MQSVSEMVLEAFSQARPGRPSPALAGLTAVPFHGSEEPALMLAEHAVFVAGVPALRSAPPAPSVAWAETVPPHPARVRARNLGERLVVIDAGTVLDGGMSTRTVRATAIIPPRAWVTVGVEPLGARWWDEGAPHRAGRLAPVAAALLAQAVLGDTPASSSARTALWTLSQSIVPDSQESAHSEVTASGWTLWDGHGVVAAWLAERECVSMDTSRHSEAGPSGVKALSTMIASVREGLERQQLEAHVLRPARGVRDVVVFPRDLRLVDHVLAGAGEG